MRGDNLKKKKNCCYRTDKNEASVHGEGEKKNPISGVKPGQNLTSCSLDDQSNTVDERDDQQSLHGEVERGVLAHLEHPEGAEL